MQAGSLARRYARALMQIAVSKDLVEKLGGDLRGFAQAMRTAPELLTALSSTSHPRAVRRKVADAILLRLGAHEILKSFSYLLLDKERMSVLPDISRELDVMIEARAGRVKAEVTSAVALTPAQVAQLTTSLETLSGKKIVLQKKEDPTLLGGVVAKVGDVVYDGSLRTQLRTLRDQLAR